MVAICGVHTPQERCGVVGGIVKICGSDPDEVLNCGRVRARFATRMHACTLPSTNVGYPISSFINMVVLHLLGITVINSTRLAVRCSRKFGIEACRGRSHFLLFFLFFLFFEPLISTALTRVWETTLHGIRVTQHVFLWRALVQGIASVSSYVRQNNSCIGVLLACVVFVLCTAQSAGITLFFCLFF